MMLMMKMVIMVENEYDDMPVFFNCLLLIAINTT